MNEFPMICRGQHRKLEKIFIMLTDGDMAGRAGGQATISIGKVESIT